MSTHYAPLKPTYSTLPLSHQPHTPFIPPAPPSLYPTSPTLPLFPPPLLPAHIHDLDVGGVFGCC